MSSYSAFRVPAGAPGSEIAYAQRTTNVTVTSGTEATPDDLGLSLGAVNYDGNPILLEFFCGGVDNGLIIQLWDGATFLCRWADLRSVTDGPIYARLRVAPTPGAHTYKAMGVRSTASNGTLNCGTGSGGAGTYAPGFIRATRV